MDGAPASDGDLFPPGIGDLLAALMNPPQAEGPPYTHTFRYPATEYDEHGCPLPQLAQPNVTVHSARDEGS